MDDDFDKLMHNTLLYGTGVLLMQMDEKLGITTRIVPLKEYTELGEALEWIQQNSKDLE